MPALAAGIKQGDALSSFFVSPVGLGSLVTIAAWAR